MVSSAPLSPWPESQQDSFKQLNLDQCLAAASCFLSTEKTLPAMSTLALSVQLGRKVLGIRVSGHPDSPLVVLINVCVPILAPYLWPIKK